MTIEKEAVMNNLLITLFVVTALAGCSRSDDLDNSHAVKWYMAHDAAANPAFLVDFLGAANSSNNRTLCVAREPEAQKAS